MLGGVQGTKADATGKIISLFSNKKEATLEMAA